MCKSKYFINPSAAWSTVAGHRAISGSMWLTGHEPNARLCHSMLEAITHPAQPQTCWRTTGTTSGWRTLKSKLNLRPSLLCISLWKVWTQKTWEMCLLSESRAGLLVVERVQTDYYCSRSEWSLDTSVNSLKPELKLILFTLIYLFWFHFIFI